MPDDFSSVLPDVAARAVATRRDLHRFPELGMIEFRMASRIGMPGEDAIEQAYKDAEATGRRRSSCSGSPAAIRA